MKKIIIALLVIVAIGWGAWFITYNGLGKFESFSAAKKNSDNLSKLKIGMAKQEVLQIMGKPDRVEVFSLGKNGRFTEFLFYRTKGFNLFFRDADDNFTPVAIDNDNAILINWGWKFYNDTAPLSKK